MFDGEQAAPYRKVVFMSYENGLSMEERVSSLFQPDTLLPDQYLDTYRRKLHLEPEKKLMLAILEDAVACFQKYVSARDGKGQVLFQDAEGWIMEENDDGLFSFAHVCETLGFDPAYLRQGLKAWKQQHAAHPIEAKVYRLSPRRRKSRRGVPLSGSARRHLRRAAGR